jgi:hypothetical protein
LHGNQKTTRKSKEVESLTIQLGDFLERMNADQMKFVAARFAPNKASTTVSGNKKVILETIKSPNLCKEVVQKLSPLEYRALQMIKRADGLMSAWDLLLSLAMQGFEPPSKNPVGTSTSIYRSRLASQPFVPMLAVMLRDGLLLPNSPNGSWFSQYSYYSSVASDPNLDFFFADARLLEHVKDSEFVVPPLDLKPLPSQPKGVHPSRIVLEFADALCAILDQDGFQITRDQKPNRQGLSRILKNRPWLEKRLESYLPIAISLDLVSIGDKHALPSKAKLKNFYQMSMVNHYNQLINHLIWAVFTDNYQMTSAVASQRTARQALVMGLKLLPDFPVAQKEFFEAIERRILRYVITEKSKSAEQPKFFTHVLQTELHAYGLVEFDNTAHSIALGRGLQWQNQPKQTQQPALLIQPNFDVIVYLDQLSSLEPFLALDCKSLDKQTATYTITRNSIYRALQLGLDSQQVLDLLQKNSVMPLPANVIQSIKDWAGRRERLQVTAKTTLLEYHNTAERDAALPKHTGARAVGQRFLLVGQAPAKTVVHRYDQAPARTIAFGQDGAFHLLGGVDLLTRSLLTQLCQPHNGRYVFLQSALQKRSFTPELREAFFARVQGTVPVHVYALLEIWQQKQPAPNIGQIEVFQHPLAKSLANHPSLKPCLDAALNDTTYLVKPNMSSTLRAILEQMGVSSGTAVIGKVVATELPSATLKRGIPTRTMREMIEAAINQKQPLTLEYFEEIQIRNRYGYPEKYQGDELIKERILPSQVYYEASTPYFSGTLEDSNKQRRVRIGYIEGIAVG